MATASLVQPASHRAATRLGLFLALFGMVIIRQIVRAFASEPGVALSFVRELAMFALAGGILLLVRKGENLSLRSIGIGTSPLWKSLLWGMTTAILCLAAAVGLVALTHYGHGEASKAFAKLPLWLITLTVIRAGVVEEICYRGYAIERLQSIGLGKHLSWALPLAIFAVAHWTGGFANIVIALVLGGILTAFYLWRRDLVANIFAHFLVDFVGNVLPALLG